MVLVVIWVALWGQPSLGNVLTGLVVAGGVTWMFPGGPGRLPAEHEGSSTRWPRSASARSSPGPWWSRPWDVAMTVLAPGAEVAEAVVAVPLRSRSPVIATVVANAITLTPGTMTIEGPPGAEYVLFVNVLGLEDPHGGACRRGRAFERLAVRAFGGGDRARWSAAEAAALPTEEESR